MNTIRTCNVEFYVEGRRVNVFHFATMAQAVDFATGCNRVARSQGYPTRALVVLS